MANPGTSPGPIADRTFDRGFKLAVLGGLAGIATLYWIGVLSPTSSFDVVVTLALFPVYLLCVAVVLGVWLGYDTNQSNLKRVVKHVDRDGEESEKPGP